MSGMVRIKSHRVVDLLMSLVDRSLVVYEPQPGGPGRYRLLETTRQYALEKLQQSGQEAATRERHRDYFLQLAEQAEPHLVGPDQAQWLDRLETEHDNLRAGLQRRRINKRDQQAGLRLAGALFRFWDIRGYWSEGKEHLQAALSQEEASQKTPIRAKALNAAGNLAWRQGDYARAQALYEESLAIRRELGDKWGIAQSLLNQGNVARDQGAYAEARFLYDESLALFRELGETRGISFLLDGMGKVALFQGDYAASRALHEESLTMRRELGDKQGIAASLGNLGIVAFHQGDYAPARALLEESLALFRELGEKHGIALSLNCLGSVTCYQGDYVASCALHEEGLTIQRELGDKQGIAWSLNNLALAASRKGELIQARVWQEQSLSMFQDLGDSLGIANTLENLAEFATMQGQAERAVRLWAAAEVVREAISIPMPPNEKEFYDHHMTIARSTLGEPTFAAAWEQGHTMSMEQAVEYAIKEEG